MKMEIAPPELNLVTGRPVNRRGGGSVFGKAVVTNPGVANSIPASPVFWMKHCNRDHVSV